MMSMTSVVLALGISALLIYPITRALQQRAFFIAAGIMALAFGAFLSCAPNVLAGNTVTQSISWLPQLGMEITLRLDVLALLFSLLVTGVGALVLLYCVRYFAADEEGLCRFAAVFLGFAASMLGLVLADNIYLFFIFWEATSIFSFLLIGHVFRQRTSRVAALQALMVTTAGGLAMFVGFVILHASTGIAELSGLVTLAPSGPFITVAVYLVLAGALSKSAIFPFHFWLPGAMAAPTPVSAYLHAAAMVKAGIYLLLRFGPGFGDTPGYRVTLVLLGALTLFIGGLRALKQHDIKQIIAHGTVSQLGLMVMVIGISTPAALFAGLVLVFAHAVAKAPLFLAVGIIDHRAGTRDLSKLSGIGRSAPALAIVTCIAAASMAGMPPLLGFIAKESAFTELMEVSDGGALRVFAIVALLVGSMLTVAYTTRFLWAAFATKRNATAPTPLHPSSPAILIAPTVFALLAIGGGVFAAVISAGFETAVAVEAAPGHAGGPSPLALWHGFTPALALSIAAILGGLALAWGVIRTPSLVPTIPEKYSASHAYWVLTSWLDIVAVRLTALTQRGSLPFYLAVILGTLVAVLGGTLVVNSGWLRSIAFETTASQPTIAVIMIGAAVSAIRARTRFQAVVLVGITGYGMTMIFALHGAPDLALTQALVETVTLIAFILVIRRLPQRIRIRRPVAVKQWLRIGLSAGVGIVLGGVALTALNARIADPISLKHPDLAYFGGHGKNTVNVMLVDIRGWDTMGELSVILAAATGVASLIFISTRIDRAPKISRVEARTRVAAHMRRVADPLDPARRNNWLLAGRNLDPSYRSIMLEVVVRLIFHALIVLSFMILLSGHNAPGGGFAAGLVAGLALVARYLAGGRDELGATIPVDAGKILGTGLAIAATMGILPLFFGQSALSSAWVDLDLGPLGVLPLVSSAVFDIGVYLVVLGLVLDVLRSLGGEIDKQEEREDEDSGAEVAA